MKVSNFLQLKIYRRTFLIYLFIVTVFYALIVYNCYRNALIAGQQAFTEQMNRAFLQVEHELDGVTETIDNFFARLFGSPSQKEDFLISSGPALRSIRRPDCGTGLPSMRVISRTVTIWWQIVIT